jgi:hypothetical protein
VRAGGWGGASHQTTRAEASKQSSERGDASKEVASAAALCALQVTLLPGCCSAARCCARTASRASPPKIGNSKQTQGGCGSERMAGPAMTHFVRLTGRQLAKRASAAAEQREKRVIEVVRGMRMPFYQPPRPPPPYKLSSPSSQRHTGRLAAPPHRLAVEPSCTALSSSPFTSPLVPARPAAGCMKPPNLSHRQRPPSSSPCPGGGPAGSTG